METSVDKEWASEYLLDPLNAPQPSEETGPGTTYTSIFPPGTSAKSSSQIEEEKRQARASTRSIDNGRQSPPAYTAPRQSQLPRHQEAFNQGTTRASSVGRLSSEVATSSVHRLSSETSESRNQPSGETQHRRGNSLNSRFPGDQSHRPLDLIKKDTKRAQRAPHLRKDRHIGADSIDRLAGVDGSYHHSGPYDSASLARNRKHGDRHADSPIAALSSTNREALRATPREKVIDSIKRHRPLEGIATTAPGMPDPAGRILQYEEGSNMMIENGGNYKRWEGREYHPDDIKGKGEPSYSIEKALAQHKKPDDHRRNVSDAGFELTTRPRASSDGLGGTSGASSGNRVRAASGADAVPTGSTQSYAEWESDLRQSNSHKGSRLVNKIGSLRHRRAAGNENE